MKIKRLYILTIVSLFYLNNSKAQTVPWVVTPTSQSHTIVIPDSTEFMINNFTMEVGDYIGVLYDSLAGQLAIGGMVEWQGITTNLLAYGDDGPNPGFNTNDVFQFIIWDKSEDCVVELLNHQFIGGLEHPFSDGSVSVLDAILGDVNNIFYPHDYYCLTQTADIFPLMNGHFYYDDFNFSATPIGSPPPLGLTINATSGIIDASSLNVGVYEIDFGISNTCLRSDSFLIEIGSTLNDTLSTTITNWIQCGDSDVQVVIDSAYFSKGVLPYTFELSETTMGFISNTFNPDLGPLTEGNYQLQIDDANNCRINVNLPVQLRTDCDNGPVLTPDLNPEFATYDIDCTGQITIYNRFGQLVNSLVGPISWDGVNSKGEAVPTGLYIIFCNGEKQTELTVIR